MYQNMTENQSQKYVSYTEKNFWVTTAHHELLQQIFYVNIVTANTLVTATKEYYFVTVWFDTRKKKYRRYND